MAEEYLGDGLYASFDGFSFTLRAPRYDSNHCVVLEPAVLSAFERFVKATKAKATPAEPVADVLAGAHPVTCDCDECIPF